jgi:hypothetical protein
MTDIINLLEYSIKLLFLFDLKKLKFIIKIRNLIFIK